MDKTGIGFLIIAFVGIVIGLTLLLQSAKYVGIMTSTQAVVNQTITAPAAVGGITELSGQKLRWNSNSN